ncbi:hypothetical protein [Nonomuraea sp. NPDC049158]|uniref:hypothetical protein n=1 Tax=Nonomuraea sp. NPDC049158 TaxID=3155649 RepID=UPI0033F4D4C7
MIIFWVEFEADKQALVRDEALQVFAAAHFDGHQSVLLRASRLGELTRNKLSQRVVGAVQPYLATKVGTLAVARVKRGAARHRNIAQ